AMDNGMREKLLTSEEREEGDLKGRVYDESKKIWRVALPGIIARVASFGTIIVTQSFIGHISSVDLAGYALVQTLTVRFANGVLIVTMMFSVFGSNLRSCGVSQFCIILLDVFVTCLSLYQTDWEIMILSRISWRCMRADCNELDEEC
ncbi:protein DETOXIFICATION 23, partial [Sesamum angolense]